MKKSDEDAFLKKKCGKKLKSKMKYSFLIASLVLFQLSANTALSQKKMEFKYTNVPLKHILNEINSQTGYRFFYNVKEIDVRQKISIKVDKETIREVLDRLSAKANFNFKINENQVVLTHGQITQDVLQEIEINGTVTDKDGTPLPGANIIEKGTTNGTQADFDGNFSIEITDENAILIVSYVGFTTQEISVSGKKEFNLILEETASSLDEVVVVGYGSVKKTNLTGAVASIKAEELPKTASTSVTHMLSGQASGVVVTQNSAQPGGGVNIVVRGSGSIEAGNQPLYVIDGFPINNNQQEPGSGGRYQYGNRNPLNSINPNDIASIEILKDASSTAIYGARAANGVILITTKRGREGKTVVEVSSTTTIQRITRYFDMLDAKGFMEQANVLGQEYYIISQNQEPYGPNPLDLSGFTPRFTNDQILNTGSGTDWWDEVTRLGQVNEQNLSISGGSEKTNFLFSANYFNQKGVVYNSDFKRISSRLNLDHKFSDRAKMGISLTGSYIDNGNTQLGEGQWENSGVLVGALAYSPLVTIYDAYGEYSINPNNPLLPNPVSYREIDDSTINKRLLANTYFEVKPINDLIVRFNVGVDDKSGLRSNYLPNKFLYGAQLGGVANKALNNSTDLLFNTTINYNKTIANNHNINVLLGYEYQEFKSNGFSSEGTKFFTDIFGSDNIGAGEGTPDIGSYRSVGKLASYFSRISYNFKEKYLLNFTIRRDGTSNFGKNNKWGVFPSVALAWKINEEEFLKSVDVINALKLRVSYGQTGNSGIGDRAFQYYRPSGQYLFGGLLNVPVSISQLSNENLKWENTSEFNVGLDFGLFRNRINGSFEYYKKVVDDLLAFRDLPSYSVLPRVADNIGATELSGFEFNVTSRNLTGELKWTTNFNLASYTDKWKTRNPDVILSPWQKQNDPIRARYGYKTDGIVQIGDNIPHMPNALPGNLIYQDLNGYDANNLLTGQPDGKIDSADRVFLGSWDPGFSFGIGNTFEYKNFDLNFFFYGMADRIISNPNVFKYKLDAWRLPIGDNNMMTSVTDIYLSDKPSATTPGLAVNPYQGESDFNIEDGSFIRLKNITLGYTIPKSLFKDALDVRLFVDGQNLLLFTKYSGVDPETDSLGSYPNIKSYSLGLNVKF